MYKDGGAGHHDQVQDSDDPSSEGEGAGRQGVHEVEGGRRRAASNTSSNSYGILHHEVTKRFAGLKRSNKIHDNRLEYGGDKGEHNRNMTAPLRRLLIKDAADRMMNSGTHLALHEPERKTHQVTDASQCGIAATPYQEDDQGKWVPEDHTSRALSVYEQGMDT